MSLWFCCCLPSLSCPSQCCVSCCGANDVVLSHYCLLFAIDCCKYCCGVVTLLLPPGGTRSIGGLRAARPVWTSVWWTSVCGAECVVDKCVRCWIQLHWCQVSTGSALDAPLSSEPGCFLLSHYIHLATDRRTRRQLWSDYLVVMSCLETQKWSEARQQR